MSADAARPDSAHPEAAPTSARWNTFHRLRRVGHHGLRLFTIALIVGLTLAIIGFFRFTDTIADLRASGDASKVDAIVALTGGYQRIDQALELLEQGVGQRLLISGVNPSTTSAALRRATGSKSATFACCVDIGYQALDTIGNANETAGWIRQHGYGRVLVVTNNYHMPRSLLELSQASPDVTFLAHPVTYSDLTTEAWLTDPMAMRTLITEYAKYSLARLRNWSGTKADSGMRAATDAPQPAAANLE
ncbi:YdcF family protein [uncultured Hoeflea sp.]|uniref:YdcF family protein n=1 Tax=uncultured Hoeflea sp. TaxID=538666 RepID=UPI0026217305|nr:YdcF family protein [uncultured Hoeflea sp.]